MVTKEEINGYFLEAVRRLKAEGYTQKDIVEAAGLSQNTISKIKTGQSNAGDDTINKLCTAFHLNTDFFYRRSKQFKMEEKDQQPASAPTIDNGSAINAALAAKDETIETLKARIVDLQRTIADKESIIRDRDARILTLERQLANAATSDLSRYPFNIGAAEDGKRTKTR
jgi:transcriptional regulator with XRE-family HTH domain